MEVVYSTIADNSENVEGHLRDQGWDDVNADSDEEFLRIVPVKEYSAGYLTEFRKKDERVEGDFEDDEGHIYGALPYISDFEPFTSSMVDPEGEVFYLGSEVGERDTVHFIGEEENVSNAVEEILDVHNTKFSRDAASTDLQLLVD